jgi:hypothetical protein
MNYQEYFHLMLKLLSHRPGHLVQGLFLLDILRRNVS